MCVDTIEHFGTIYPPGLANAHVSVALAVRTGRNVVRDKKMGDKGCHCLDVKRVHGPLLGCCVDKMAVMLAASGRDASPVVRCKEILPITVN